MSDHLSRMRGSDYYRSSREIVFRSSKTFEHLGAKLNDKFKFPIMGSYFVLQSIGVFSEINELQDFPRKLASPASNC